MHFLLPLPFVQVNTLTGGMFSDQIHQVEGLAHTEIQYSPITQ
jgi:hypothetical protein